MNRDGPFTWRPALLYAGAGAIAWITLVAVPAASNRNYSGGVYFVALFAGAFILDALDGRRSHLTVGLLLILPALLLATRADLAAATRSRTEAALSSFLTWAYRQGYVDANPMVHIERVRLDPPSPRGKPRGQVNAVLAAIPPANKRDQLPFRLIAETGLRIGEALAIRVEDLDLVPDDEHLSIVGKGGRRRTVLLEDDRLVTMLPLLSPHQRCRPRPAVPGREERPRWAASVPVGPGTLDPCADAGVECTLRRLRHSHGPSLSTAASALATIRKRLGHRSIQSMLRYAEQSDATSDAELPAWRRRQTRAR